MNKVKEEFMNQIFVIGKLHEAIKVFVDKPSQENIDLITNLVSAYENCSENIKNGIIEIIKEAIETQDSEEKIDAEETEFGYKL